MKSTTAERTVFFRADQVAEALFSDVYCPMTALVSLNDCGDLIKLKLFDTLYAPLPMPETDCASACLIFGHPDGWRALHPQERKRFRELRSLMDGKPVRIFLAGEELGCVEMLEDKAMEEL